MIVGLKASVCRKLLLTYPEYDELVKTAPARYKIYKIDKKSNPHATRTICQPAKELKQIQYHLINQFLNEYPIHAAATAYVKGTSAYLNGATHAYNPYLIKIDFKNFFNSVKSSDFSNFIKAKNIHKFSSDDIEDLCRFLFWYNYGEKEYVLSIGAPSSPVVSNILLYDFDSCVADFCNKLGCIYTRYADDITISGINCESLNQCHAFIIKNLATSGINGIKINSDKTRFLSKKGRRTVTGFVISNEGRPSLGREKNRRVRAMVHKALSTEGLDQKNLNYLKGILGHIKHFDPPYWQVLERTYGEDFFKKVIKK